MEHLDNDMDDLFQKAGELYPLKTTGSDWDAVAGKLQNESPGDVHELSAPTTVRFRRRTWLLLLLLIPLGLGIFYYSRNQNPGHQNASSAKPLNNTVDQSKTNTVIPDEHLIPVGPAGSNKTTASDNIQNTTGKKNTPGNGSMIGTLSIRNKSLANAAGGQQLAANNIPGSKKEISSADDKTPSVLNSNNSIQGSKEPETVVANKNDNASSSVTGSLPKAEIAAVPAALSTQHETTAASNKTAKTEPSKKTSQDSSLVKKKTNTASKQSRGFYVGLFAGPDVSTVKFQSVKNLGYSLGALIGYRFNSRFSIESGLIWDKKYYYSSGEYFNKEQLHIQPSVNILNVNGHCNMFEIPLALRYDFPTLKKHNFFVTAGLSSYLMTSEYYSYLLQGAYGTNSKDSLYNSSNKNILSIIKLSVGYDYNLNSKTKIRFEPYMNIPLQGVGFGSMPISSLGFYIGLTHSFR